MKNRADAVEFLDYINADAVEFLDYINADAVGKGIQQNNKTTKQQNNQTTKQQTYIHLVKYVA